MEKELFEWENYDIIDEGHYNFLDVTLKQNIGQYKKGDKFEYVDFNYQTGILTINEDQFQFSLKYENHLH